MMSLAPLLLHSESVPPSAKQALRAASAAHPGERDAFLVEAAHILHAETGLACEDVKELVGLPNDPRPC